MANARMIAAAAEAREGNICIFDSVLDEVALRELVNMLSEKCTGYAAAFSGSDETGWRYIIGSRHVDLRKMAKEINSAICGKGGGTPEMMFRQLWLNCITIIIKKSPLLGAFAEKSIDN